MNAIRRLVVATLLAVWCFPAVSSANPPPRAPAPIAAESGSPIRDSNSGTEIGRLAAREQQARQLQDFKGGRAIILGSSVVVVLLVVLLVLLLV